MSWLDVREYLRHNRFRLGVEAAARYPRAPRLAGTALLTRPDWVPDRPVDLAEIAISLGDSPPVPELPDSGYAAMMAEFDPPAVFENRPTYRLLSATLTGDARLEFGPGRYFDHIDTGEAAAHEYAAGGPSPLRDAIGDPCDLTRRPANLGISVLTVRSGRSGDTFFLHWRDPARVGHAGGLYQVLPVGVFQAAGPNRDDTDFSLWHCILREYAEELLGEPERSDVDYLTWPFAVAMTDALLAGRIRASCLGLGVDPLTFATDLLVSVVIDAAVFDDLFGAWVARNDEGTVTERPFTSASVAGLPMQAAGAAVVGLALNQPR
ncbi:hypothetical protein [Actinophytocola sediminis]